MPKAWDEPINAILRLQARLWRPLQRAPSSEALTSFGSCSLSDIRLGLECWNIESYGLATEEAYTRVAMDALPTLNVCCGVAGGASPPQACANGGFTYSRCCACFPGALRVIKQLSKLLDGFYKDLHVDMDALQETIELAGNATAEAEVVSARLISGGQRESLGFSLTSYVFGLLCLRAIMSPAEAEVPKMHHLIGGALTKTRLRPPLFLAGASEDGLSSVFNPFVGRWHGSHFPVFDHFKPVAGPPREGQMLDFLGMTLKADQECPSTEQDQDLTPSRFHRCRGHAEGRLRLTYPLLDEEYFEWAAVLAAAAAAATRGGPFAMAEIGSGPRAPWATRAAVAFNRLAHSDAACDVFAVDPALGAQARAALLRQAEENLPPGRCHFATEQGYVGVPGGARLLEALERASVRAAAWDLVDMDCQGGELEILRFELPALSARARMLHVSTHGREIHWEVLARLRAAGWHVPVEFTTMSAGSVGGLGPFLCRDGHITAYSPAFA